MVQRQSMVLKFGAEEESLRAERTHVLTIRHSVIEHVNLDGGRLRKRPVADVAAHLHLPLEGMLDEVQLQLRGRVERVGADPALVNVAFVKDVRRDVQLDFVLGSKRLLAFDALVRPTVLQRMHRQ